MKTIWFWRHFRSKTAKGGWKRTRYLNGVFTLHFSWQKPRFSTCGFSWRQRSSCVSSSPCSMLEFGSYSLLGKQLYYFCPFQYFVGINFWMAYSYSEKVDLILHLIFLLPCLESPFLLTWCMFPKMQRNKILWLDPGSLLKSNSHSQDPALLLGLLLLLWICKAAILSREAVLSFCLCA